MLPDHLKMKTSTNRFTVLWALSAACVLSGSAAVLPPDQLLADDTLAVLTIPDYPKAKAVGRECAMSRLWDDPALKPFREKLTAKLKADLVEPLEKEFGIRFNDYRGLAQGQITLAVTRNGWDAASTQEPGFLLLVETKDKTEALKSNLVALRKKWVDSGKQIKTETIRNVEFTALLFSTDDLTKTIDQVFPDPDAGTESLKPPKPAKPGKKLEWLVGQSESLFVLGNSAKEIEKVLVRQGGGSAPSLREQSSFAQQYAAGFRDAQWYGWVNIKTIVDVFTRKVAAKAEGDAPPSGMVPSGDKILNALGLNSIDCLAWSSQSQPEGNLVNLFVGSPEASRKGLTKLLAFEAKDAAPPPFIPAEAVKFSRWRLDLQKGLNTLESMLVEAAPQFAGVIKLVVDNAGKDKDPNFDLRQNLIANLGNDIISFEKLPRKRTLESLNSAPALVLISSPRSDQLASALKAVTGLLPTKTMRIKEREFLGRTVYSMDLPPTTTPGSSKPVERALNFAASGGYVAISTDEAMLEEYLRSSSGSAKSLLATPGLAQAADKIGGMQTGLFGYENQKETTGALLETLKKDSGTLANLIGATPLGARLGLEDETGKLKEWLDFSLLPPFEQIAKYFYLSVWSGAMNANGMTFKVFAPHPPGLR
jgi:hypothetical protein